MRLVLDTNVLLAGFATHGLCEALLTLCFRDHEVVLSQHILDEVAEHYAGKFKADPEQVAVVMSFLRGNAELVTPVDVPAFPHDIFDDPDDLPVLGTAVAGRAARLVTGDKKLLALDRYQEVVILSPRGFYDLIRGEN